jgi:hypothetical protein
MNFHGSLSRKSYLYSIEKGSIVFENRLDRSGKIEKIGGEDCFLKVFGKCLESSRVWVLKSAWLGVWVFESAWVFKCAWKVREDGQSSSFQVFKGLCRVGLCKVRGGGPQWL